MGVYRAGESTNKLHECPLPLPPTPAPPLPKWNSVTRREIERFWRKKRMVEEDHFVAAIKAAARLRATHFSEVDYLLFLDSLEENKVIQQEETHEDDNSTGTGSNQEIRLGIKDWWTKSRYAYLNQPVVGYGNGNEKGSRRSFNYTPNNYNNKICVCTATCNNNYTNFRAAFQVSVSVASASA